MEEKAEAGNWFIETSADFREFVERQLESGKSVLTLDFEADSMHRYGEQLCLIQFSDGEDEGLIDPLAIDEMSPLLDLMGARTIWMHGADYDIQLLKQTFGEVPEGILDTQTAARFLGYKRFGYAAMVEQLFDVELSKSSQRDDWAKRPLTPKMREYALNDVRYMLPMAAKLEAELKEKGRWDWFLQVCAADLKRGAEREGPGPDEIWRIKGSGKLDCKGLACLRELWHWRDAEARDWDRPCFMVARNADLITWSQAFADDERLEPRPKWRPQRKRSFISAVKKARALDSGDYPEKPGRKRRPRDPEFDKTVDRVIDFRNKRAEELGIDPSFIVPRWVVEMLAHRETVSEVTLLPWQEEVLGEILPEGYGG